MLPAASPSPARGGLGIPGGMAAGVLAGIWVVRRNGWDQRALLDCAAPVLPLAQAIGRWGNWFNQELFGRPSDLPWALEISPAKAAAAGHPGVETFHPTFLYESLWNFALAAALILIDRTGRVRRGSLISVYVLGYATARLWLETVRIDPASDIAGLRVNEAAPIGVYCASKHAVLAYAEALHDELAAEGIGVSTLCPGGVRTKIGVAERNRPEQYGGPSDAVAFGDTGTGLSPGIAAEQAGRIALRGLKAGRRLVLTHPETRAQVEARYARIMDDYDFLESAAD